MSAFASGQGAGMTEMRRESDRQPWAASGQSGIGWVVREAAVPHANYRCREGYAFV